MFTLDHLPLHYLTSPHLTLHSLNLSYLSPPHFSSPLLPSLHLYSPLLTHLGQEGQEGRPDQATRWLWLVRLCFDRRSSVRTLSIRILGVVLKNTRALPSVMERAEERRYDDHTDQLGELSNMIAVLPCQDVPHLAVHYPKPC